ncbi:chromosome segregation protein SMC [Kurthia massiliensis]|uniref:chromosome segregation protein SMC n=1 Tax=Kurthia massiliensis TaxID=1033739 RepID=UPI0002898B48|nr:chromosome segregation protein SMC [Kurthia massiliensis]
MFLKRLEVIGFKSFADRIGIDFVPGVTAVVGPNGSGKSNVIDAIRWVLGEQSAKSLRGAKMEDVIFAGSDSRKPLNFAEVTLILDNEDERLPLSYNEVSVSRRVYRSGESEYLLNKQSCRLKDITDLFLDSGLGKEAFSIISQGRVDEILNSKPDDRRAIFEEAAGVLKYKKRRKKAEHKLFETDDNLNRVLDILHELDGRIEPLRIQASAAEDYVAMNNELRGIDIAVLLHDIEELEASFKQFAAQKSTLSEQENAQRTRIEALQQDLLSHREALQAIDTQLDVEQAELVDVSSDVERYEGRKAVLLQKRENMSQQLQQLEKAIAQATDKCAQLRALQEVKMQELAERNEAFNGVRQEVKDLQQALARSTSEIEEEIETLKNTYIDRLNEQATAKNELKNVIRQIEQQQLETTKMSSASGETVAELRRLQAEEQQAMANVDQLNADVEAHLATYKATQTQYEQLQTTYKKKRDMLYQGYQQLKTMQGRKETLEELSSNFEGFYKGPKMILQARDERRLTGVIGAVAEMIQVPAPYALAIETTLGATAQHIITETDQHASSAIQYLRQHNGGRATFLPKNIMKPRQIPAETLQHVAGHPSFIQTADQLVEASTDVKTIVGNLLGHVMIAKDLDGAKAIAQACHYRYRVVTLEGDVVNAGGSMTGGSTNKQNAVFTRKAELETLTARVAQLDASILEAEQVVKDLEKQVGTQERLLEEQRQTGDQLKQRHYRQNVELETLSAAVKRLAQRVSLFDSERQDVTSRVGSLADERQQLETRLTELEAELVDLDAQIDRLNTLKAQSVSERDQLQNDLADKKAAQAVKAEQVIQLQSQVDSLAEQLQATEVTLQEATQERAWLLADNGEAGPTEEELVATIADLKRRKEALMASIQTAKENRQSLQQTIQTADTALTEAQRVHQSVLNVIRDLDVKMNRIDVTRHKQIEQLEQDYNLTYQEALLEEMVDVDIDTARRKVKLLRQSIEELGDVNVLAIEEYKTVSERHEFLTSQRNDLLEAKDTLHEAIREMDEEMTTRFSETFASIRTHFGEVFRELFGGGKADLILLDPENLLETGIEIVAQPPGKKLQSLSLLSGGERALTAIALLFAILKTRPVPFCILDEVEAALDEANVNRYSQYLKKFSDDTQFIVITHRKGTMEGADVLYGITMQESGVSKLVSVKLEQEMS